MEDGTMLLDFASWIWDWNNDTHARRASSALLK